MVGTPGEVGIPGKVRDVKRRRDRGEHEGDVDRYTVDVSKEGKGGI